MGINNISPYFNMPLMGPNYPYLSPTNMQTHMIHTNNNHNQVGNIYYNNKGIGYPNYSHNNFNMRDQGMISGNFNQYSNNNMYYNNYKKWNNKNNNRNSNQNQNGNNNKIPLDNLFNSDLAPPQSSYNDLYNKNFNNLNTKSKSQVKMIQLKQEYDLF